MTKWTNRTSGRSFVHVCLAVPCLVISLISNQPLAAEPAGRPTVAAAPNDDAALVRAARMKQREALRQAVAAQLAAYEAGTLTLDILLDSHSRLAAVELQLAGTPKERIEVCRAMVQRALQAERRIHVLYSCGAGGGTMAALTQARAARLGYEAQLIEERVKARQPGEGPLVLTERYNPKDHGTIAEIERLGGQVSVDEKRPELPVVGVTFSIREQIATPPPPSALGTQRPAPEDAPAMERPGPSPPTDSRPYPPPAAVEPLPPSPATPTLDIPPGPSPAVPGVMPRIEPGLGPTGATQAPEDSALGPEMVRATLAAPTLRRIGQLTELRTLNFTGVAVTDEALAYLAGLDKLVSINLSGSKITMAGLGTLHFERLRQLKRLDLRHTSITPAEIARLRPALPGLIILPAPVEPPPITPAPPAPPLQLPVPGAGTMLVPTLPGECLVRGRETGQ